MLDSQKTRKNVKRTGKLKRKISYRDRPGIQVKFLNARELLILRQAYVVHCRKFGVLDTKGKRRTFNEFCRALLVDAARNILRAKG